MDYILKKLHDLVNMYLQEPGNYVWDHGVQSGEGKREYG